MRAWTVREFGPFREKLALGRHELPKPTGPTALIKVHAAGINFPDLLMIEGKYQVKPPTPFIPGGEATGVVVEVGDQSSLGVGDRIITSNQTGAFAEYMLAKDASSFAAPEAMTDADAAALLITYQTSYFALAYRAQLKAGEYLLVHGGAGGVGTSAIQIGKALGATVIATAGADDKLEVCRQCGADYVINYSREDFVPAVQEITKGHGADVIYDPVGGDVFDKSTKCIAWEGRLLVIGFAGGRIPQITANRILLKNISVVGLYWGNYFSHQPELIRKTQEILYQLYAQGKIKPVIYREYPLEGLPEALAAIERRECYGKLVLKPAES